jgi:hypothetical protein
MGMTYNGQKLKWDGVGEWDATSGLDGFQEPKFQTLSDKGPIPEGTYRVPLKIGGNATVTTFKKDKAGHVTTANLDTRSEIESLQCIANPTDRNSVLLFQQWGSNRVRLLKMRIKNPKAAHRDGFYLHDSTKGFTHGCVEVDTKFFTSLRNYSKTHTKEQFVELKVEYSTSSTLGNTKTNKPVAAACT